MRHRRISTTALQLAFALACADANAKSNNTPTPVTLCPTAKDCLAQLQARKDRERDTTYEPAGPMYGLASRAVFLGGKAAFAPLAQLITARNGNVANAAIRALGGAGPQASAIFPALARELNAQKATGYNGPFNAEITWAVAAIDRPRAIPLLKAAVRRGYRPAAYYLRTQEPEIYREILSSPSASKAVELLLSDYGGGDDSIPLYQLASKNSKLPPKLKQRLASALAESAPPEWGRAPASALDEALRLLADTESPPADGTLRDPFRVVAQGRKNSAPLVPRLVALQKNALASLRATWALGEIPDPAARAALTASLGQRENWRVALLAANALGRQATAAGNSADALRRLATGHWHPVVRATANSAAQSVLGKSPPPVPIDSVDGPGIYEHDQHWGESRELLSSGFRCRASAAWGKPSTKETCPFPPEVGKTASCTLVHRLESGWLRIDDPNQASDLGFGDEKKSQLGFLPANYQSRKSILPLKEGYLRGVTGGRNRAFAVESEHGQYSHDETRGPGRTWLDGFEKRGASWEPLPAVELPAGLAGVTRLPDGGLQLAFPNHQLVLRVGTDGQVASGDCQPDPYADELPVSALLQAVLDDATFAGRLKSAGAEVPLRVSFDFDAPADSERLRFAGQPVVLERNKSTIAAGRTLAVWGVEREFQRDRDSWIFELSDVLALSYAYPAMQIEEKSHLKQERGVWTVLPPESVSAEQPSSATAPPPPDVQAPPHDALVTESGLSFKVLQTADTHRNSEESPGPGAYVTVEITAWTSDGALYFPRSGKTPATVELPLSLAMGGLGEAIATMRSSELRRFWIPAKLAHATPTADAKNLVFDIRLVSIAREEEPYLFPDEMDELEKANRAPRELASPPRSAQTTPSGLKYRVLETKKGRRAESGNEETTSFTFKAWTKDGKLLDHGTVGQGYRGSGSPQGSPALLLIDGMAEAVRLMRPGKQYRFWIPAALAYGDDPHLPNVPAGMILVDLEMARR